MSSLGNREDFLALKHTVGFFRLSDIYLAR